MFKIKNDIIIYMNIIKSIFLSDTVLPYTFLYILYKIFYIENR